MDLTSSLLVRMESDEESDSPDSIVPASSPESILGEDVPRFPLLTETRPELEERVLSPVIPIIPRASIPGGPAGCGVAPRRGHWVGCAVSGSIWLQGLKFGGPTPL